MLCHALFVLEKTPRIFYKVYYEVEARYVLYLKGELL